jgi:hypothetical protein
MPGVRYEDVQNREDLEKTILDKERPEIVLTNPAFSFRSHFHDVFLGLFLIPFGHFTLLL